MVKLYDLRTDRTKANYSNLTKTLNEEIPIKEVHNQLGQNKEGNRIVLSNRLVLENRTVLGHGRICFSSFNADKLIPIMDRRVTFIATDLATSDSNFLIGG